jgi:molybdenum cofactor biosynthesis protein B
MGHSSDKFVPLGAAVLTVSDTRTEANDTSGSYLKEALTTAGHKLVDSAIITDDAAVIRNQVSSWIGNESIKLVLITGGTGFYPRDVTPTAVDGLFDHDIPGFGELFRSISFDEIGASTIQSRALAGIANKTLIFCLPGSTGACRTGWEQIISSQVDSTHKPCNFINAITGDD